MRSNTSTLRLSSCHSSSVSSVTLVLGSTGVFGSRILFSAFEPRADSHSSPWSRANFHSSSRLDSVALNQSPATSSEVGSFHAWPSVASMLVSYLRSANSLANASRLARFSGIVRSAASASANAIFMALSTSVAMASEPCLSICSWARRFVLNSSRILSSSVPSVSTRDPSGISFLYLAGALAMATAARRIFITSFSVFWNLAAAWSKVSWLLAPAVLVIASWVTNRSTSAFSVRPSR